MAIIIIAADRYQPAFEIARQTAERLNYQCFGRDLLNAAEARYKLKADQLLQAFHDYSMLGLSRRQRTRYLAYVQEQTLSALPEDRAVCCGLGAHLYVRGVSHVVKIRLVSDVKLQVEELAKEVGATPARAQKLLVRSAKRRRRLAIDQLHLDEDDPSTFDIVLNLDQIEPAEALNAICETASYRKFQPMTYSLQCLRDLVLSARVRALLIEQYPEVRVRSEHGTVVVEIAALKREKQKKAEAVKQALAGHPGINYVEVHVIRDIFRQAVESFR